MTADVAQGPLRLVVADDTPEVRMLLRHTLEASKAFTVVGEASDGREAVHMATVHRPDVLLLDLAMPGMDGLEAIPEIVRWSPATRIIVLSGFDADRMAARAMNLGAVAYIEKRYRPDELVAHILAACPEVPLDAGAVEEKAAQKRTPALLSFQHAPIGSATLDPAGRFCAVNDAFVALTGFSAEDLLGRTPDDVEPANPTAADAALLRRVCSRDVDARQVEQRHTRTDGSVRWVLVSRSELRDADAVRWVVVNLVDITNAKEEEELLRERERHLTQAQRLAGLGRWEWDVANDQLVWSDGVAEIYGVALEQAPTTYEAQLEHIYPDDRPGFHELVVQARSTGGSFEVEHRVVRPDGSVRWAQTRAQVVRDANDRILRVFGTIQDVTERRARDEALREVTERFERSFHDAPIGMAVVSLDGCWLEVNEALCEIVGYTPDEMRRRTYQDITHPDDLDADLDQRIRVLRGDLRSYQLEKRYIHADGRVVWISLSVSLVHDADGDPAYFVVQIENISDRRDTEARLRGLASQLEQANAELRRSNDDLSSFASVAAHDLKSPLQVIVGYGELLSRLHGEDLGERGREFVTALLSAGDRMDQLIDDLLAFCRVGSAARGREPIDLTAVIDSALAVLGPTIDAVEGTVERGDLPTVLGDLGLLSQLVQNLLSNALKFSSEGVAPSVTVSAEPRGDAWVISITDNGIGVPGSDRERVFGMFERLHARELYDGTGIGLAICKRIVEQHGGEIWIEDAPGGGSCFRFTLPGAADDVAVDKEPTQRAVGVLVVEDDAAQAGLIAHLLDEVTDTSYTTRFVTTIAEARRALVEAVHDCVLLDLHLPDADGLDAVVELLRDGPPVPLVVLTSRSDEKLALAAVREGAQDYLVKGRNDGAGLSRAIRYAIERHHLDAEVAQRAMHDELTGLANRALLIDRVELALSRATRSGGAVVLFYGDLDGFKSVNDRWGHEAGDRVLMSAAHRLRAAVRPHDTVARVGGDEFVVLCEDLGDDPEALDGMRRRLEDSVAEAVDVDGANVSVAASIGVAVGRDGVDGAKALLHRADMDMYRRKRRRQGSKR